MSYYLTQHSQSAGYQVIGDHSYRNVCFFRSQRYWPRPPGVSTPGGCPGLTMGGASAPGGWVRGDAPPGPPATCPKLRDLDDRDDQKRHAQRTSLFTNVPEASVEPSLRPTVQLDPQLVGGPSERDAPGGGGARQRGAAEENVGRQRRVGHRVAERGQPLAPVDALVRQSAVQRAAVAGGLPRRRLLTVLRTEEALVIRVYGQRAEFYHLH